MTEADFLRRLAAEHLEHFALPRRHGAARYVVLAGREIWEVGFAPGEEPEISVYDLRSGSPPTHEASAPALGDLFGRVGRAWRRAAEDLGVELVSPFSWPRADGTILECSGWLPHFGGPQGTVIITASDPQDAHEAAEAAGFYASGLNPYWYDRYDRARFMETLRDWGWYGPEDRRPGWLVAHSG